jgi:hypothetical protein
LNQRPFGPQPSGNRCLCVPERPPRPMCPRLWTLWTHRTMHPVPKRYCGPRRWKIGGPIRFSLPPHAYPRDQSAPQLGSWRSCFRANATPRSPPANGAALHGKQHSAARYCVGEVGGETSRQSRSAAPRADGSRLRTRKPRLARPNVPRMYRRVGDFWPSNRHRSLDSLGGPTPRLEGGPK